MGHANLACVASVVEIRGKLHKRLIGSAFLSNCIGIYNQGNLHIGLCTCEAVFVLETRISKQMFVGV